MNLYYAAREKLIKELVREGCKSGFSDNLALDIAVSQCRDLICLRGNYNLILSVCLAAGRLDEVYAFSCYYARDGVYPSVTAYLNMDFDDTQLDRLWKLRGSPRKLVQPFIKRGASGTPDFFIGGDVHHWPSLCHIFLVKYLLHMEMEKLRMLDGCFLHNQDCTRLIGRFLGVSKEWVRWEKNWYRDQAFDVIRLFHIEAQYNSGTSKLDHFEEIQAFASECADCGTIHLIDTAIREGRRRYDEMQSSLRQEARVSDEGWGNIIDSYKDDHRTVCAANVLPALPLAASAVNVLAGYSALGTCFNPALSVTSFITEATRACQSNNTSPSELFRYMDLTRWGETYSADEWDAMESKTVEFEESVLFPNDGDFYHGILACLLIESKLAQCHFHRHKGRELSAAVLDRLPGGREAYNSDPPHEDPDGIFHRCIEQVKAGGLDNLCSVVESVSTWLPDVTRVVDAIFAAGIATENNLSVLFGNAGYVSYRIMVLHQKREERTQRSIAPFITRTRFWKRGCTDNDKQLGLKIWYLNVMDRREKFREIERILPIGTATASLEPSVEQMERKFGWDHLGLPHDDLVFYIDGEQSLESTAKRPCRELDKFLTLEDACRHFYDTETLEEAVWDAAGVPRLIVLNGNTQKMREIGWRLSTKPVLGDKSVQLGNRAVHVYFGLQCTVWKEQKAITE